MKTKNDLYYQAVVPSLRCGCAHGPKATLRLELELVERREITPMLAILGCCNNLPGCGTSLCDVKDKHTQNPIFYNLF